MEERSLVTPSLTQMGEEVTAFVQEAHDIIIAAARSALKLEQPSNLRRSHALELRFEWNPKKGKEKRIVLLNVVTLEHNPDFTPDHAVEKLRILVQVVFEIGRRNG